MMKSKPIPAFLLSEDVISQIRALPEESASQLTGWLNPLRRQSSSYTSRWLEHKGCFPYIAAFPSNSGRLICWQTLAELPTKKAGQSHHATRCETAPVRATGLSSL